VLASRSRSLSCRSSEPRALLIDPRRRQRRLDLRPLLLADPPRREAPRRRDRGRARDQHDVAELPHDRPRQRLWQIVRKRALEAPLQHRLLRVSVVIAGDDRDALLRAQPLDDPVSERELGLERQVRQVTRDEHVLETLAIDIVDRRLEDRLRMLPAAAEEQVQPAQAPLAGKVGRPHALEREHVQIGDVRDPHAFLAANV
jgi:hypothetical protein